jgi:hypothetical protein
MSAQTSRPIGIFAFASALLALGAVAVSNRAFAADCLTAPGSSTPPNGHWYYRTDRAQQRKCWFLRTGNQNAEHGAAAVTGAAPDNQAQSASPAPNSLASFKQFMTQRTGAAVSDQEVERLYAEFLEWNRRAKD